MSVIPVDMQFLQRVMLRMLEIPSPTGYTDQIVHFVAGELGQMGIPFGLTRRGAIRATLAGRQSAPARALVGHLDTLGAMVKQRKPNGRLEIVPIGTWSSRFAEGARVTIFSGHDGRRRGTVLPLKASGHIFNEEVDSQPVRWDNVELRVDERYLPDGINVGDFVAFDANPEITPSGFVNSRHLDDKAGAAVLLTAAKALVDSGATLPLECHMLFTLSEEVGSGASAVLAGDVAEMVAVDNATPGPGQNGDEFGVTLCIMDQSGPFDYHLSSQLIELCQEHRIDYRRDVFRHYRSDAASAVEAGTDVRTALVCFGVDASHGYERTHLDALSAVTRLITAYLQSEPVHPRDRRELGPLEGFPTQPT